MIPCFVATFRRFLANAFLLPGVPDGRPTLNCCRRWWQSDLLPSRAVFSSAVSCFSFMTMWSALRASAAKCSVLREMEVVLCVVSPTEKDMPNCRLQSLTSCLLFKPAVFMVSHCTEKRCSLAQEHDCALHASSETRKQGGRIPLRGLLKLCPQFFGVLACASQQLQLRLPLLSRTVLTSHAGCSASETSPIMLCQSRHACSPKIMIP